MNRRSLLKSSLFGLGAGLTPGSQARAALSNTKITRIRYYRSPPNQHPVFNLSTDIVTIETDQGITGIGEGGTRDMIEQLAGMLIGENPWRIEHLWQVMYRGYFYPPGREKLHGLGALDMALWDIKGKALGVPVYELLGGLTRNYLECYSTGFPNQGSLKETARACMEAGFRAFRTTVSGPNTEPNGRFDSQERIDQTLADCREIREGVGQNGAWVIDYHTRLDMPEAIRMCSLIESLRPFFVEDLVRSENPGIYRVLRAQVKLPIAVGEQFGDRWDADELIEGNLIDYSRVSIPNVGGITEYMKLAALCETHYIGLVPHFTGPVSVAALVHCNAALPGPVLMEMLGRGPEQHPHLPQHYDFRNGKLWPNQRPGLGVEFDPSRLQLIAEITKNYRPIPLFQRPDGSVTNF